MDPSDQRGRRMNAAAGIPNPCHSCLFGTEGEHSLCFVCLPLLWNPLHQRTAMTAAASDTIFSALPTIAAKGFPLSFTPMLGRPDKAAPLISSK